MAYSDKKQRIKKLEQVFENYANEEHEVAYEQLKSIILEMSANLLRELEDDEDMIEMMNRDEGDDLAYDIAKNKKRVRAEELYDEDEYDDLDEMDDHHMEGHYMEDEYDDLDEMDDYHMEHDYDDDMEHDYGDDMEHDYGDDMEHDYDDDMEYDKHEKHHDKIEDRVDDLEDDFAELEKEFEELMNMEEKDMDYDEEEMEEGRQMTDGMGKGYGKKYKRDSKFYHQDLEDEIVSEAERLHNVKAKHPSHKKAKSPVGKATPIDGIEADAPKYKKQPEETSSKAPYKKTGGSNTRKSGKDLLNKSKTGGYKK